MSDKKDNFFKYKMIALIGLIIMGIGSFLSCLVEDTSISNIGTFLLCFSIVIMSYAFYYWEP